MIEMRIFIGGIIGASLAAAGWLSLEYFAQMSSGWLVCLVGLGAGLGVRWSSKASSTGGSLRGALAVILALAGIFLGRQVYTQIVQSKADTGSVAKAEMPAKDSTEDSEKGEEATEAEDSEANPVAETSSSRDVEATGSTTLDSYKKRNLKSTLSESDMLWMSLSGLLAYVLGKHDGPAAPVTETTEPTEEPEEA